LYISVPAHVAILATIRGGGTGPADPALVVIYLCLLKSDLIGQNHSYCAEIAGFLYLMQDLYI